VSKNEGISKGSVNLFKLNKFKRDWSFPELIDFINLRAAFSFSTMYVSKFSMTFLMDRGSTSNGALSPSPVGIKYSFPVIVIEILVVF
jgi:hypothetical protein